MEEDMEDILDGDLKILEEIRDKTGAAILSARILSEMERDRIKNYRNDRIEIPESSQKNYSGSVEVKIPKEFTKKRASELITEALDAEE